MNKIQLALAAAAAASATPVAANCGAGGCGTQPPGNGPQEIIVSNMNNFNANIGVGVRTDISSTLTASGVGYGGTAYGGDSRSSAQVGNVTGGAVTVGQGSLSPQSSAIVGDVKAIIEDGAVKVPVTVEGDRSTTTQNLQINNPRPAFAPAVSAFAAGNCGWGASFSFGAPGLGLGPAFAGQSSKCHNRETARQLLQTGVASGNPDLAATGMARLVEGDKKLGEAFKNRGKFIGMFAPAAAPTTAPITTYVVPPAALAVEPR